MAQIIPTLVTLAAIFTIYFLGVRIYEEGF